MNQSLKTMAVAAGLLVALFAGSVWSRRHVDRLRGQDAPLEEILYLPSGKAVKRMSLGYSSLMADVYWTRAVQYFGGNHVRHSDRFDLLYPLLDITTDLDPHLIVAYQAGSVFLCERAPMGAGQPDKAVALLEKGIRENPEYWRLYFTLGFVHYLERRDYKAAEQAFLKGAEVPGALPWMRTLAARMAEHAQETDTAIFLWRGIYDNSKDPLVRESAVKHLQSLQAKKDIEELRKSVQAYRNMTGTWPANWMDLVRAGLLPGFPKDPAGHIYKLLPDGSIWVEDPKEFSYLEQDLAN